MIPIVPIALALAQVAPSLMRYFGAGEENANVAERVVNVAKQVAGEIDPKAALEAIQNSQIHAEAFRELISKQIHELELLYYKDVESARARDVEIRKAGGMNNRANWLAGLALLIVAIVFAAVWTNPDIPEFVKGIVTLVLGRFLGYVDQIYNFEFGTTRSSRDKDSTIDFLSKKGK